MSIGIRRAGARIAACGCSVVALLGILAATARSQFQLGIEDPAGTAEQERAVLNATRTIDGSAVRVAVFWASVAPDGSTSPPGFDPADPADPHYHWGAIDSAVRSAAQHHLGVILTFLDAPRWAEGPGTPGRYVSPGAWNPDPAAFAAFIHAAALRYSGSFPDPQIPAVSLPRVSYWEPWNEPNIPGYFSAPNPVSAYRTLLNRAYAAVKGVHPDNLVLLGGLAPVSPVPGSTAPLDFGAALLCLHRTGRSFDPNPSCPQRTDFDVFAVHPYSLAATPTKHAYKPGDDLVGDMGEVSALVRTSDAFHTAYPTISHQIWVTEFAWFTNPPNALVGDSEAIAARYVAYSLYEMWRSGVSLIIWLAATDSRGADINGGGLYSSSGRPKLMLRAVAFPVIASVTRRTGFVWGRAPAAGGARVVIERASGRQWRNAATTLTGPDGVFTARFRASGNGVYRARVLGGLTSLAYDSRPIPPVRTHLFTP
jgi:hypothetical protein